MGIASALRSLIGRTSDIGLSADESGSSTETTVIHFDQGDTIEVSADDHGNLSRVKIESGRAEDVPGWFKKVAEDIKQLRVDAHKFYLEDGRFILLGSPDMAIDARIRAARESSDLRKRMTFKRFSEINRARSESPEGFNHPMEGWSLSDWFVATMGELGEAANVLKKLNRCRDGIPGNNYTEEELRVMLGDELADTFIYLNLLIQAAGFDMEEIVRKKFNETSAKIGFDWAL